jgi:putative (di)nucleoside polyphosphate hydrolase
MAFRHNVLPYRAGVGVLLADAFGNVLMAHEADGEPAGSWRMLEGAIGMGESEREAALRVLHGQTGWRDVRVLAEAPGWFTYELPRAEQGVGLGGLYCGQRLKWLAVRAPAAAADKQASWRWVEAAAVPTLAAACKRQLYEDVIATFAPLLLTAPVHAPAVHRPATSRRQP